MRRKPKCFQWNSYCHYQTVLLAYWTIQSQVWFLLYVIHAVWPTSHQQAKSIQLYHTLTYRKLFFIWLWFVSWFSVPLSIRPQFCDDTSQKVSKSVELRSYMSQLASCISCYDAFIHLYLGWMIWQFILHLSIYTTYINVLFSNMLPFL